jgi:hypothetical protein
MNDERGKGREKQQNPNYQKSAPIFTILFSLSKSFPPGIITFRKHKKQQKQR